MGEYTEGFRARMIERMTGKRPASALAPTAADVWTCAAHPGGTPNTPGNAASTCADWSDAGAVGERGIEYSASSAFFEISYDEPCR